MTTFCKCGKPAAPNKLYCSKQCSPLGHMISDHNQAAGARGSRRLPAGALTADGMGARLGVTGQAVRNWAKAGRIPFEDVPNIGRIFRHAAVRSALDESGGYKNSPRWAGVAG